MVCTQHCAQQLCLCDRYLVLKGKKKIFCRKEIAALTALCEFGIGKLVVVLILIINGIPPASNA